MAVQMVYFVEYENLINFIPYILTALSLLGGGIAWAANWRNRQNSAASVLTGSALDLVKGLETRLAEVEGDLLQERKKRRQLSSELNAERIERQKLESRVLHLERENRELQRENDDLKRQLKGGL